MEKQISKLSRLMKMSWEIQRRKRSTRSKALQSAWAILINEDITIYYLVQKHNHRKPLDHHTLSKLSLFINQ